MEFQVRDATEADVPAIVDIYNQSIPGAWSTADTKPVTVAERLDWFREHDPPTNTNDEDKTLPPRRSDGEFIPA